jgi:hypothetical protein
MQYVLIISTILLILYAIWFFKNIVASNRAKRIHRMYQTILDQKLLPLGFEKKQEVAGGREKIAFYKRSALKITLSYEISYNTNRIFITNGRKSNSVNIDNIAETKNNFIRILEKWLTETP